MLLGIVSSFFLGSCRKSALFFDREYEDSVHDVHQPLPVKMIAPEIDDKAHLNRNASHTAHERSSASIPPGDVQEQSEKRTISQLTLRLRGGGKQEESLNKKRRRSDSIESKESDLSRESPEGKPSFFEHFVELIEEGAFEGAK